MYIKPLPTIIDLCLITHHSFVDDMQLQMSASSDKVSKLLHPMQSCITVIKDWATANMLKMID